MKNILLLFLILITIHVSAQQCNCPQSFDWMVSTFEQNDAGFQYVIDKKGKDDYAKHTEQFREKAKAATTINDCQGVMYNWLRYFRPGHIAMKVNQNANAPADKKISDAEVRTQYKNSRKVNLTEKQFIALLDKKKDKSPLEGIWRSPPYIIGIIAKTNSTTDFDGFIIKADSVYWMPGQVKVELKQGAEEKENYGVTYYMRDHSTQPGTAKFVNEGKSLMLMFNNYWTKEYPKTPLTKQDQLFVNFSTATFPFVEKLSDKTLYLRIPSFAAEQKKNIDSVLKKYDTELSSTPNLIIDIRNGTGGSDAAYQGIIPYLYTQPIRSVGVQLYSTEMNAKAFEGYAKQDDDSSSADNYCNRVAAKMRRNIGKFITMSDETFSIDTLEKVMPYPQKVAIICNHHNGSTDEQFLLIAKASNKVKVYGQSTGGMLDISNMNFANSPDGHFSLGYCMSKSFRIPNYCIDGVGIQPDYFIDSAIPEKDWIEYTRSVLEQ